MNIFDHILPDVAILGIGPLMLQHTADASESMLYASRKYYFDLHLSAHSVRIESDWFQIKDNPDEKDKMKRWKENYFSVRDHIAKLIGEDSDMQKFHQEFIGNLYKNSLQIMEELLSILQPANDCYEEAISLKAQRLASNIEDLKNHALK